MERHRGTSKETTALVPYEWKELCMSEGYLLFYTQSQNDRASERKHQISSSAVFPCGFSL
jgi:hypothetical protein